MIQTEPVRSLQNNRKSFLQERSGTPGWIDLPVQPGSKPLQNNSITKGGDENGTLAGLQRQPTKKFIQKERGLSEKQNSPMDDKCEIMIVIEAARQARLLGAERLPGPNPTPGEHLGIRINMLRRRKNKNLIWMNEKTGYPLSDLMAFEAGILSDRQMLAMLPGVLAALDINASQHPSVLSQLLSIS